MDNEPLRNMRLKRMVFWIIGLSLLIILSLYIVLTIQHKGLAKIRVYVVPPDSKISRDGGQASKKTVYLSPGEHSFTASRQDFTSDTETLNATLKGPNTVYLAPTPKSPAGQQWVTAHPDLEKKREYYAGINQDRVQKLLNQTYPIVKDLPVDTVNFTITYGPSKKYPTDPSKIALYVSAIPANQPLAIHWIKYKGYNPNNYEIIYQSPQ